MSKPTIAHVLLSFGVGGQERVVLDLIDAQKRDGYPVKVIALSAASPGDLESEFRARGADVFRPKRRAGFDFGLYQKLWAYFRKEKVGVVHTHNPAPLLYGAASARLAKIPVVHTKHGEHRDLPHRMAMRRAAARAVSVYVAVSETTADFAREHDECNLNKLRIIRNGTNLDRFTSNTGGRSRIRRELGIGEDASVAICVGRFVPEKNQELLLNAASKGLSENRHLVFVGDGQLHASFVNRVSTMSSRKQIHVLGQRSDIPDLLHASDVFVISSRTEGLPIGLLEAMAVGLPVVSTRVGGIPNVIEDGVTGVLVDPLDAQALGAAIERVLSAPEWARELGQKGKALVLEDFGADRMHREYASVYAELTEDKA